MSKIISIKERLKTAAPLLCDFTDLSINAGATGLSMQNGEISYPFSYEIGKWKEDKTTRNIKQ